MGAPFFDASTHAAPTTSISALQGWKKYSSDTLSSE
jgi:hypothetical protein